MNFLSMCWRSKQSQKGDISRDEGSPQGLNAATNQETSYFLAQHCPSNFQIFAHHKLIAFPCKSSRNSHVTFLSKRKLTCWAPTVSSPILLHRKLFQITRESKKWVISQPFSVALFHRLLQGLEMKPIRRQRFLKATQNHQVLQSQFLTSP